MNKSLKKFIESNRLALERSEKSLGDIYEITFRSGGNIIAETDDGFRIHRHSYGQVKQRIEEVAAALHARIGETHGYVALEMENSLEWMISFWAILRSGNKPYLVNCRHPKSLSDSILKNLNIRYVVALERSSLSAETICFEELRGGATFSAEFENEIAFATSATSLKETVCFYHGEEVSNGILNAYGILKTSPRMAAHYHGSLKHLAFLPFYHVFGLMAVLFWFTFFGRTLVFLRDYAPDTILKTCRRHEVTHIFAVPMLWHTVEKQVWRKVKEQGKEAKFRRGLKICTALQNVFPTLGTRLAKYIMGDVTDQLFGRSIQFCISGGSYLRSSALELMNGMGYALHNGYGMSELGITSVELRNRPKQRNLNSIGRPFDSVEYRIGEDGTLYVRGSSVCRRIMVDGVEKDCEEWIATGDCMDCIDGDYYIRGRIGDMVLGENGENINPDMLEQYFSPADARSFCILGMGSGESQELSMVVQLSPFLPGSCVQRMIDELYAINETLPSATRVQKFYFTHDAIISETAIKVSRKYLLRGIENGQIRLISAAQIRKSHDTDEQLGCNPALYAKICGIIARELDLPEEEIGPDDHIIFDLGGSSLQYFAVLDALAGEFSIAPPSDSEEARYTLREICQYIERHV